MAQWRCMKGVSAPSDLTMLRYPLLASVKLDGWRCLVAPIEWARANIPCEPKHREYFEAARWTIALSASNKPISNLYVQRQLDRPELVGLDGELLAAARFNETSSALASFGGEPAFEYHIFDRWDRPNDPFDHRLRSIKLLQLPHVSDNVDLFKHPHVEIHSATMLSEYLEQDLPLDAEGAITRDPKGPYKFGRATEKQQWMLKHKPFMDAEAVVVGIEELLHNLNDPEVSQLGLQRRSHHQAGKVPGGKLGALICVEAHHQDHIPDSAPRFRIGTGFTDADRHTLWAWRDALVGRVVKFKYMKHGTKNAPRHPVFLGLRAEDFS